MTGSFFLKMFMPHLLKPTYMIRHIPTLCMNEEDAKADYVRHITEIKAHVPADKVINKMGPSDIAVCASRLLTIGCF